MKLSLICERRITIDGEYGGDKISVHEDPSPIAVVGMLQRSPDLEYGGWISEHGIYIWNRYDASHEHIAKTFGIKGNSIAFTIIVVNDNIYFEPSEFSCTATTRDLYRQPFVKNTRSAWKSRYSQSVPAESIQNMFLAALRLYDCGPILEASWPQEWSDSILHSQEFIRWLNSLGITGKIGPPMAGGVGRAYPVGDRYIVKFTTDRKEASAAAIIKGHDSPHAATIYDVKLLKSFPNQMMKSGKSELYAIAMERLTTGVGKRYRVAANAVYDYLDRNPGFIDDPNEVISIVSSTHLPQNYRGDKATEAAVRKIVYGLHDIQQRTGVLSQDPHGGNIAFKGKEPGFYDFGRSSINWDHPKTSGVKISALS